MISVPVYDIEGTPLEPMEVDEQTLGGKVRLAVLREAVQMYEMNKRVCTKATLSRAGVSGSTRKMYRQKHTGYARAGQRSAPQRRGGGVAFAHRPRDLTYHLPRKERRIAARSALLARLTDGTVRVVTALQLDEPKTKRIAGFLRATGLSGRCLLVCTADDTHAWISSRNIACLTVRRASDLNAYHLMDADCIVFTRSAFQAVLKALGA